jgi:hypothetical protein
MNAKIRRTIEQTALHEGALRIEWADGQNHRRVQVQGVDAAVHPQPLQVARQGASRLTGGRVTRHCSRPVIRLS